MWPKYNNMLKVGITGGIGSGKTTVCRLFELLGAPVYYADERARYLMHHDVAVRSAIVDAFGAEAYTPSGELDRAYLAQLAFADPQQLQALNAIVHPAVAEDEARWQVAQEGVPYTLKEAAILFESGSYKNVDRVIVVYAPRELRLARAMQRDGASAEAIEARMAKQMPEEEKLQHADYIVHNDGQQMLIPQVWALHRALLDRQAVGE